MQLVYFSHCIVDDGQPRRILPTFFCTFSVGLRSEWVDPARKASLEKIVDFDSGTVSLYGGVYGRGSVSFACGVLDVPLRSTREFLAILSNVAISQPLSHGRPAMGAYSKHAVLLSHRKGATARHVFAVNE